MKIENIRHSLAHIMAHAIDQIYPGTKFGIGPVVEQGFYYDLEIGGNKKIAPEDLPKIEEKMKKIIKRDIVFKKKMMSKEKAREIFKNQPYKLELIGQIKENKVRIYESGNFIDLCRGPHIKSSREIPPDSFKLTRIAGAYWRGNEKNPMLTRIYGAAFKTKRELEEYLKLQKEAEKRDHRLLGEKLELFLIDSKVGKGLPLWLPKGYFVRRLLEEYIFQLEKAQGYLHVLTPHLAKEDLYKTSGHLAHYKKDMYAAIEIENERYYLRPMNCPHHHSIYKHKPRSYKELPLRIAEFGTVFRKERSGVLSGLIRTRGFTQNDAHIYTTPEKLQKEITSVLKMIKKVYKDFGISDWWFQLSLPDFTDKEKYAVLENKKVWEAGISALRKALIKEKAKFIEKKGEATFYGPKIDIQVKNVRGQEDTIATLQVDYYSANRFNLFYIDKKGKERPVIIIHRAIFGSFERFFAFLLERTEGNFPLWLAPLQIWIIPVASRHRKSAYLLQKRLSKEGIRSEARNEAETVSKKIRLGELQKIPYLLVIGDIEQRQKSVRVRKRKKGDRGIIKIEEFVKNVKKEIERKK